MQYIDDEDGCKRIIRIRTCAVFCQVMYFADVVYMARNGPVGSSTWGGVCLLMSEQGGGERRRPTGRRKELVSRVRRPPPRSSAGGHASRQDVDGCRYVMYWMHVLSDE